MSKLLAAGETAPDQWINHSTNPKQIYVQVKTGLDDLKEVPIYICSLAGDSEHWSTTGGSAVYAPSPQGFRVNVRIASLPPDGRFEDLTAAQATKNGWTITWAAFSRD